MNEPARVNRRGAVAETSVGLWVVTKKPEPEMARSVGELVDCSRPCWVTYWVVRAWTPPELSLDAEDAVTRSENSVWLRL